MAEVIWTQSALLQLNAIADYIALDNEAAAKELVQRIRESAQKTRHFKLAGLSIPGFKRAGFRQIWIKPCWVYYQIKKENVLIIHIRRGETLFRLSNLLSSN